MEPYRSCVLFFTAVISCAMVTCENCGTCVDTRAGFACMCDRDYYGDYCEHSRIIYTIIILEKRKDRQTNASMAGALG